MSRGHRAALALLVAVALTAAAPAAADVAGPDDTIATAFGPIDPAVTYSGTFRSETDVDYLAFDVTQDAQTLHFDVRNTVDRCLSPDLSGCPVYATLIDAAGRQLGGEGSTAGTGAVTDAVGSDTIDWTFATAGRYYLAMDSGGDLPSYRLAYRVLPPAPADSPGAGGGASAGGGSPGGGSPGDGTQAGTPASGIPPLPVLALSAGAAGRGDAVRARFTAGRALQAATLRLQSLDGHTLLTRQLGAVPAGTRSTTLALDAGSRRTLARHGTLTLRVRLTATARSGEQQVVRRSVRLRRR